MWELVWRTIGGWEGAEEWDDDEDEVYIGVVVDDDVEGGYVTRGSEGGREGETREEEDMSEEVVNEEALEDEAVKEPGMKEGGGEEVLREALKEVGDGSEEIIENEGWF